MATTTNNEADILSRIIDPQKPSLSSDAARSLLDLSFGPDDIARMNELSAKASAGTLTDEEQELLNSYERIGHLVAILHSKARVSLKNSAAESPDTD